MASSNRHWPSMFKSKPCNTTTHSNWPHELNTGIISNGCHRTTYSPGPGCEERTPEPKPRWNPRPEQIRILESIFNSGMVNPPRDEIRKIRAQLQEYGQVGDANVFYWFQNRKSRSKHKQRQIQKSQPAAHPSPPPPAAQIISNSFVTTVPPSSSSSSSDKSSLSLSQAPTAALVDLLNSPTASVNQNQPYLPSSSEFLAEPFFFPVQQNPSYTDHHHQGLVGNCSSFLLSELMLMSQCPSKKEQEEEKMQQMYYNPSLPIPPHPHSEILTGVVESEVVPPERSTVFINEVWFEVGSGPFNVREAFGDDAVLIQSTGQPVMTNEWGVTLQPLQHGGFYYLLRPFAPTTPAVDRTIDLI